MGEIWDERRLVADGFEHVYAELEWYDGPRDGLVDVDGVPHYFQCHDLDFSVAPDEYFVWPADETLVALEREQWAIFVAWNDCYEAGTAGIDRHPGQGGIDPRYDELTAQLTPHRQVPADAKLLVAEWRFDGKGLAGLDEHQVRRFGSWSRWVTLAMLAHAFLAVVRADEHNRQPIPQGLIPLTCNEIHRLFITLVIQPTHDAAHRLDWSDWRRRHQARSKTSHFQRQAAEA